MSEILIVNPSDKPSALGTSKGAKKMAKKKVYKKNPQVKKYARAAGRRMFGGMNVQKAVKDAAVGQGGILMAQFFAKKLGTDGKSPFNPDWDWDNYLWASLGALAGGVVGNVLMPGKGQKTFEHGLAWTMNKFLQDKVVQKNDFLKDALGSYNRLSARYANPSLVSRLNPPASASFPRYDRYGRPQRSATPTATMAGRIEPEGALGGAMQESNYMGNKPFSSAFIES